MTWVDSLDLDLEKIGIMYSNFDGDFDVRNKVVGAFKQKKNIDVLKNVFMGDMTFADVTANTLENYSMLNNENRSSFKNNIGEEYDLIINDFTRGMKDQKPSDFTRIDNNFIVSDSMFTKQIVSNLAAFGSLCSAAYVGLEGSGSADLGVAVGGLLAGSGSFMYGLSSRNSAKNVTFFNHLVKRAELIDGFKTTYGVDVQHLYDT